MSIVLKKEIKVDEWGPSKSKMNKKQEIRIN